MIDYLRTLLLFYKRHLRAQPLRELMAVVGVAAGVALLFAIQVAHGSITGSFEQIAHGVAGNATIELASRGPEGFNERISEEVEGMADVKATAPIFQDQVVAVGPKGRRALTLVGSTEQLASLGGAFSLQFLRVGEASRRGLVVLTEPTARALGARPGSTLTILAGERIEHLPVAATIPSDKIGPLAESSIAAASLPVVQSLAGSPRRVTRILVEPKPGHEPALHHALEERFGATLNIRPVNTEARLLGNASGPEQQVTLLFSAISLVTGAILAYNALLLASDERRRFIIYLIEAGTPDSMIVASLAFDAFILGLVGSVLGVLAGDAISLVAYRAVPGYIAAAFAIGGQRVVGIPTIAIALAGGMLAAFAAAALPAMVALRGSAAAEPEAVGRTLTFARKLRVSDKLIFACGASLMCASIALAALEPGTTVIALVGLAAGLMVCLPLVLRYVLTLANIASRHSSDPAARVAVAELRGSPTRSVALLATGTVAVFLMVLIGGAVSDVQHAVRRGASDLLSGASVWIKPGGPENVYTTEPFAYAETQQRLQHLGVVNAVLAWRDSFLDLPGRRVWVLGVPPQISAQIAPSQLIEGSLQTADERIQKGGWVAMSQIIAREDHLRIGERFSLPTPAGFASVRLAATIANYGWLSGAIVMNGDEHARLWSETTASQLGVTLRPGITIEAGKQAVEKALPRGSALTVETVDERHAEVSSVLGSTLARLNDTTIVVLIAAVLSVIALMIAAIWQRRERLDSLMSIGMSTGQLTRLIFFESASVLLVGCLIGMAAGLVGQDLIDGWLHQTTGSPVTFNPAWQIGLRTIVIATGISVLACGATITQTSRYQPRASFSTE
ncbi:MAG TPA: FtsX-like permease family protein [Solirubrobacteraceae bacterium]